MHSRIGYSVSSTVYWIYTWVARRQSNYRVRDGILTWIASISIVALLGAWLLLFLFGYAVLMSTEPGLSFADALRESGSSLFTLGFASPNRTELDAIDFIAAATGPIVIALMIGYLPAIYASYNRREVDVAMLHARAGEPNWGPEILARHAVLDNDDSLDEVWLVWTRWASDVGESHVTYPVLVLTRSARPSRNWAVALLSVMDAAAMQIALQPSINQSRARMVLRQGIETFRDLVLPANVAGEGVSTRPQDLLLPFEDFASAVAMLDGCGFQREVEVEQAWEVFRRWRANYESIAYALNLRIDAVPALWSGPRLPSTEQVPPHRPRYIVPGTGPGTETAD